MKINYHKSFWETGCDTSAQLAQLLNKIVAEGYQGSELFLPFYPLTPAQTLPLHSERGLDIITGIATDGQTAKDHLDSLKRQVDEAMAFSPKLINSHTGRDIFSLSDNMMLFEQALLLQEEYGVAITHETHRFRPTFSTLGTEQIIEQLPELKLNLDISHWFVVHESDLTDQAERIAKLINNVHHVHARVGFEEGPQVTDPQHARWAGHLNRHTQLWQMVVDVAKTRGQDVLTITPEFGPFPYAHINPQTDAPATDVWGANLFIKQHLEQALVVG